MIEESNGKVRMIWEFSDYHWKQIDELAKKLGFSDAEALITDASMGVLQKNGLDPNEWI